MFRHCLTLYTKPCFQKIKLLNPNHSVIVSKRTLFNKFSRWRPFLTHVYMVNSLGSRVWTEFPTTFIFQVALYLLPFSHKTDINSNFFVELSWLFCYNSVSTKLTNFKSEQMFLKRSAINYNFVISNCFLLYSSSQNRYQKA